MDDKKLVCGVCGENEFTTKEGFYYCNECGTQSQAIRDIVYEGNETFEASQFRQNITTRIRTLKTAKPELTSWECFNYLLRGLVEELLELGAKDELKKVTLQLWANYLRLNKAAFFNKKQVELPKLGPQFSSRDAMLLYNHQSFKKKKLKQKKDLELGKRKIQMQKRKFMQSEYEKLSQSECTSSHPSSATSRTSSTSQATTSRAIKLSFTREARKYFKKRMRSSHLRKHEIDDEHKLRCHVLHDVAPKLEPRTRLAKLRRQTIYTILYLALNLIQDDIQLCDMLRFMREGHLSTSNIMHFFPDEIAKSSEELIKTRIFYSRRDTFLDKTIREHTAFMCRYMHIKELKTPNLHSLISRYVYDLNLPEQITIFINRLINLCPVQKIPHKINNKKSPFYEARAMAFIIFVLKLLFGLDDHKEVLISESARKINEEIERNGIRGHKKLFVWDEWVKFIEMRQILLSQCHLPTAIQLNQVTNQDQYLDQFNTDDNDLLTDEDYCSKKITKNAKKKLRCIQNIFDNFQIKHENENNCNLKIATRKFPPSLTPNQSYLQELLRIKPEEINIPKFMNIDHSTFDIDCFVKAKNLKDYFKSKHIQLKINKLACKSERNYIGIVNDFLRTRKPKKINAYKVDFDIGETEWLESISNRNDEKSNIIEISKKKSKSKPMQLIKRQKRTEEINEDNSTGICSINDLEQISVRSIDVFDEFNMNPLMDDFFREPRRNLEQDDIFADVSDDESNNEDDLQQSAISAIELNVSNFDYWIILGKYVDLLEKYSRQLKNQFPRSFQWILETCANLLGIEWDELFKELVIIENYFANVLESFENVTNTLRFKNEAKPKALEKFVEDYKRLW